MDLVFSRRFMRLYWIRGGTISALEQPMDARTVHRYTSLPLSQISGVGERFGCITNDSHDRTYNKVLFLKQYVTFLSPARIANDQASIAICEPCTRRIYPYSS